MIIEPASIAKASALQSVWSPLVQVFRDRFRLDLRPAKPQTWHLKPDMGPARTSKGRPPPAGLAARNLAHALIAGVLLDRRPLEQALNQLAAGPDWAAIEPRDRAFARMLAATVLRRQGELEYVLAAFLERPLPRSSGRMRPILLAGAAQLICLGTPPHAAVGLAVEAARMEPGGRRFAGLANAVLRRVAAEGAGLLAGQDAMRLNIPAWLWPPWCESYAQAAARR